MGEKKTGERATHEVRNAAPPRMRGAFSTVPIQLARRYIDTTRAREEGPVAPRRVCARSCIRCSWIYMLRSQVKKMHTQRRERRARGKKLAAPEMYILVLTMMLKLASRLERSGGRMAFKLFRRASRPEVRRGVYLARPSPS